MTLLDVLLRRRRPAPPRDALFALPAAAVILEAATGLRSCDEAAVCLKAGSEAAMAVTSDRLTRLLERRTAGDGPRVIRHEWDTHGRRWIVLTASRLDGLVTAVRLADAVATDAGFGSQLLCSVFCCAGPSQACHLVYLHDRGTFYPFAPGSGQRRDVDLELRVRAVLEGALPMEDRRDRWLPLWELPLA